MSYTVLLHFIIVSILGLRIIYRRMAVNTTLAWIIVIAALPIGGVIFYFLFGDHRLGRKRIKLGPKIRDYYQTAYNIRDENLPKDEKVTSSFFDGLSDIVANETGFHTSIGNNIRLFDEAGHILSSLTEDIDASTINCFLEFYIIEAEGRVIPVLEALERAAKRGVDCRIIADDFGSSRFLKSDWAQRLKKAGVQLERSLPVGLIKSFSKRTDLRNHRKLVVIDQSIGYLGSFNLVDPVSFKKDADIGQWVDIMVRMEGHIVSSLAVIFNTDFIFDTVGDNFEKSDLKQLPSFASTKEFSRDAALQLIPSGPEMRVSLIYEVIVSAIFGSRKSITIVTPYFVPDETLVLALCNAARRGVQVTLIVPSRLDSIMTRYASESVFTTLLESQVIIRRYQSGMLHTKAILIDDTISFLGTLNMDMRSFYLNLEATLAIYDETFAARLQDTLNHYIARSDILELERWQRRSKFKRLKENILRLAAPLL